MRGRSSIWVRFGHASSLDFLRETLKGLNARKEKPSEILDPTLQHTVNFRLQFLVPRYTSLMNVADSLDDFHKNVAVLIHIAATRASWRFVLGVRSVLAPLVLFA